MAAKNKTALSVTLRRSQNRWIVEMVGDSEESYQLLGEFLEDMNKRRDNPPVLILTQISGAKGKTRRVVEFKVTEGPDVVGTEEELNKLKKWQFSD